MSSVEFSYFLQEAKERADIEMQVKDAAKKIAGAVTKGGRKRAGPLVQVRFSD